MSGSTTTSTVTPNGTISSSTNPAVFIEQIAGIRQYSDLYLPSVAGSTGSILPAVNTLVWQGNIPFRVYESDPVSLTFKMQPAYMSDSTGGYGVASTESYGNDIMRAFYDTRVTPYRLEVDDRLLTYGGQAKFYRIIRYPNTNNETVISRYYDSSGAYISENVPTERVSDNQNFWSCPACRVSDVLTDGEELRLEIYNETGATIFTAKLFAKASTIINDAMSYQPRIASISINATQRLDNGDCYLFQKQSFGSLELSALLTYADGTERTVQIDRKQCFLYGAEDFVSAYAGMTQQMMIKYFFSPNEEGVTTNLSTTDNAISTTFNVVVLANKYAVPIKLSAIPVWNVAQNKYILRWLYYSTKRDRMMDVTPYVSISSGSYDGSSYGSLQSFQVSMDMSQVDPANFATESMYIQNVAIRLKPTSAYDRYVISDAASSPYEYGGDGSSNRRPVLFYDSTLNQYFIPTTIFLNSGAVIQSFYTNANPPFDSSKESGPPTPTHFIVRNAANATMLTPSPVPIAQFGSAFSMVGLTGSALVGSTVVVEFHVISDNTGDAQILYGVPVDVYTGTYQG